MEDDAFSFVESIMNGDRTADKEGSGTTTPPKHKNAPQRKIEKVLDEADTGRAVDIATATMQDNYKRAAEVYTKYQANIRAASNLRSELLLGAKAGRNPYDLLLLAARCIGSMTGDSSVYAANMAENIREGYGDVLTKPAKT